MSIQIHDGGLFGDTKIKATDRPDAAPKSSSVDNVPLISSVFGTNYDKYCTVPIKFGNPQQVAYIKPEDVKKLQDAANNNYNITYVDGNGNKSAISSDEIKKSLSGVH